MARNGGTMWTNVLPGQGRALAADPTNPNRFYATIDFGNTCGAGANGVFTSLDGGANWIPADPAPLAGITQGQLNNAKLSVSADSSRVWSSLLRNGQLHTLSYSDNNGASWSIMDEVIIVHPGGTTDGLNPREKPGGQGSIHFAMLASQTNRDEVYVGGDRQGELPSDTQA